MCAATRPWPLWAGLYQCLQNVWIQGSWEHGFHLCSIYVIGPSFTIATIILYHIHTMSPYSYPDGPYSFTWQGRFDPRLLFNFLDASHVSGQADQQGPSSDIWHIFRTNQNKSDVIVVFHFFYIFKPPRSTSFTCQYMSGSDNEMVRVRTEVGHITRNEFVQLGKLGAVEALCLGESCGVASSQLPCASHISHVFFYMFTDDLLVPDGARWCQADVLGQNAQRHQHAEGAGWQHGDVSETSDVSTVQCRRSSSKRRSWRRWRCDHVTMTYEIDILKSIEIHENPLSFFQSQFQIFQLFLSRRVCRSQKSLKQMTLGSGFWAEGLPSQFLSNRNTWLSWTWQILTALSLDFWVSEFGILRQVFTRQGLPCSFCDHARSMEASFVWWIIYIYIYIHIYIYICHWMFCQCGDFLPISALVTW